MQPFITTFNSLIPIQNTRSSLTNTNGGISNLQFVGLTQ